MRRGMMLQNPRAGPFSDTAAFSLRQVAKVFESVLGRASDQDFFSGFEDRFDTFPEIANDRSAARSSFEQPHARRMACLDHACAGHVEGEALRVVEPAMLSGRQMADTPDVFRPPD